MSAVNKIQSQIDAHHNQVDDVKNQNIIDLPINDFSCNSGNIPDDNGENKEDTFAFCGVGSEALVNGDGPGQAKANKHDEFKNLCHKIAPFSVVASYYSLDDQENKIYNFIKNNNN